MKAMLKRIGFSSAALLAMLTCVQPAALFAEGRAEVRHTDGYAEQRNVRQRNEYREQSDTFRRDRDDRNRDDRNRDRDRDRAQYRDNDDWYRYNSFRR
jgi:hypothetical protein